MDAMYFVLYTLTTVGYGDVTPITAMGKLFGAIITIIGIGTVALPSGILASGFSDQLKRRKNKSRKRKNKLIFRRKKMLRKKLKPKSYGIN